MPSRTGPVSGPPGSVAPATQNTAAQNTATPTPRTTQTTTTPSRTPSRDVEQALVDAAERVLVREGPEAVTVRAVAVEAGVAPMGIYNRFGGKDGLVDALLIRGFQALRAAIEPHGESNPSERLMNAGLRYRLFALGNSAHYLAMFDNAVHQEVQSPDVGPFAEASFEELVGHVRYGMVGGALLEGDAHEVAQQIWSAVHGAVQLEIKGMIKVPDPERSYRALLETLYRGLSIKA